MSIVVVPMADRTTHDVVVSASSLIPPHRRDLRRIAPEKVGERSRGGDVTRGIDRMWRWRSIRQHAASSIQCIVTSHQLPATSSIEVKVYEMQFTQGARGDPSDDPARKGHHTLHSSTAPAPVHINNSLITTTTRFTCNHVRRTDPRSVSHNRRARSERTYTDVRVLIYRTRSPLYSFSFPLYAQ